MLRVQEFLILLLVGFLCSVHSVDKVSLEHIGGWGGNPDCMDSMTLGSRDYLLVTTGSVINLFDIKKPDKPELVTSFFAGGMISALQCKGSYAITVIGNKLVIVDFSQPEAPERKSWCVIEDNYEHGRRDSDIDISENYVYIAANTYTGITPTIESNFHIITISDIERPSVVSKTSLLNGLYNLYAINVEKINESIINIANNIKILFFILSIRLNTTS